MMDTHQLFSDGTEESIYLDTIMDKISPPLDKDGLRKTGGPAGRVSPFVVVEGTTADFNYRDFKSVKKNIRMNVIREYREAQVKKIVEE